MNYPEIIEKLIKLLEQLPGIGRKTAERLGFHILASSDEYVNSLGNTLNILKNSINRCRICGNYTEHEICEICSDSRRDKTKICVVEDPRDIFIIENLKIYDGLYHTLFGIINPIEGISPDDLNIDSLLKRVEENEIKEIIFALSPTAEGETTIMYISKLLKPYNLKTTKLAYGLPVGSNIRYADLVTLARSFISREKV